MAVTHPVLLRFGPCDQQTKRLTIAQIRQGSTTCKGETYLRTAFAETRAHPYVFDHVVSDKQPAAKGGNQNVSQAWTRWMHALGRTGPASHRRILGATHRARRIARK